MTRRQTIPRARDQSLLGCCGATKMSTMKLRDGEPITGLPVSGRTLMRPLQLWVTAGRAYEGGFGVAQQLGAEPEFVLWEDGEGRTWLRGHGDDVAAALLLTRSAP